MSANTYRGRRVPPDPELLGETYVTVNGFSLPLRLDVANKSSSGFEWGYLGSGPAQLALAILCNEVGVDRAEKLFLSYMHEVIGKIASSEWTITSQEIATWLATRGPTSTATSI